ncbi:MAG: hypothetical protein J0M04_01460 [Verrucomicrobia bacterium]|nr:hypothetical protein [Verrucomicrobiota bacterium]
MSDLDRDGDYDFTRVLDHSARTLGRPTGWDLLDEVGTAENGAVYGYDAATGRLATVAGASAGTFSYAYTADSGLLESVTRQHPDGTLLRNIRTYDSTRDTLATISNRVLVPNGQNGFDTTVRSSYDYAAVNGGVNSIGQRKGVRTTFNPDGTVASKDISWEYDALGQVTSADGPATVADRSYQYDAIGNRIMSSADQSTTDYEADYMPGANFLNQYDTIHTPGDTWFLSHDDDGNLTYGPVPGYPSTDPAPSEPVRGWFVWDAENRLIDATADQYLYYAGTTRRYDPLGRLIWETGGGTGAPGTIYVYDGWNRIAQYALTWDVSTMAPAAALTHTYLWGPDLSGAFQGAGGVGGLLAVNRVSSTMAYPTFDGNGNITEYLDATGGVLAHFEYDPFGNTVVSTDYDNSFAYRFSTKPIDQATGWYYYGYRWYDPLTGRWPSRDPIGEEGGVNLYGFVRNDGVDGADFLGLAEDLEWANKRLKGGKECGCYKINASFGKYNPQVNNIDVINSNGHKIPTVDFGLNVDLSLSAEKLTSKPGCACLCNRVKVVQVVTSGEDRMLARLRKRSIDQGWHLDHIDQKYPFPFVSDSPYGSASGLNGGVKDLPAIRGRENFTFLAYTCLVCADSPERRTILGCVGWGFEAWRNTKDEPRRPGDMDIHPLQPYIACGTDGMTSVFGVESGKKLDTVQQLVDKAALAWDSRMHTNKEKPQKYDPQLSQ